MFRQIIDLLTNILEAVRSIQSEIMAINYGVNLLIQIGEGKVRPPARADDEQA